MPPAVCETSKEELATDYAHASSTQSYQHEADLIESHVQNLTSSTEIDEKVCFSF